MRPPLLWRMSEHYRSREGEAIFIAQLQLFLLLCIVLHVDKREEKIKESTVTI